MAQQPDQHEEPVDEMSEFDRLQFAADVDEFFDLYLEKVADGTIPIDRAERFFEGLGCTPDPTTVLDH